MRSEKRENTKTLAIYTLDTSESGTPVGGAVSTSLQHKNVQGLRGIIDLVAYLSDFLLRSAHDTRSLSSQIFYFSHYSVGDGARRKYRRVSDGSRWQESISS
jgi:hypothetical protein